MTAVKWVRETEIPAPYEERVLFVCTHGFVHIGWKTPDDEWHRYDPDKMFSRPVVWWAELPKAPEPAP